MMSDWAAGEHGSPRARAAAQHAGQPDPGAGMSNPAGVHVNEAQQGPLHAVLGAAPAQTLRAQVKTGAKKGMQQ